VPAKRFSLLVGVLAVGGCLFNLPANAASNTRVSVATGGTQATGGASFEGAISADGRFVAFRSAATNLVAGDNNARDDIFVHDRQTGVTERVSVDSLEAQANNHSREPSISADGRFIAFTSDANNLVASDGNNRADIFVRDRQTGTTERISVDSAEVESNDTNSAASISANGLFVAFLSSATNLVGGDTNGENDVFVRDRSSGSTERVNIASNGDQAIDDPSYAPSISGDGKLVAFGSRAANLVSGDTNDIGDVFVRDRQTSTTTRISVDSSGNQATGANINQESSDPWITPDGRFVAFYSFASGLVADDSNNQPDIFVRDRQTGTTVRVNLTNAGAQVTNGGSYDPSISADGRFVTFRSLATTLIDGDTNGKADIFLRDRQNGRTERVSVTFGGGHLVADSYQGSISADGRFVTFHTASTGAVPADTNGWSDVFVRDRGDTRNDLLVDFGSTGLYQRMNNSTWLKIHSTSPLQVAAGDLDGGGENYEAIASFSGAGLWVRYNNATWVKRHSAVPVRFVAGDLNGTVRHDLVVDFGASGIWVYRDDMAWGRITTATSQDLAVGDFDGNGKDDLAADIGTGGLWVFFNDTSWVKWHSASPVRIAAGDLDGNGKAELIGDFGASGLWARYNNAATWTKLHAATTQDLATGDLDGGGKVELIVDFGSNGLWARFNNNATWTRLHTASPGNVIAADLDKTGKAEVVADFGASGLWARYNNATTWTRLTTSVSQDMAVGDFD